MSAELKPPETEACTKSLKYVMALPSFYVGVVEMRSKANKVVQFPDSCHPSSPTVQEFTRGETQGWNSGWQRARGNWHKCTSFKFLGIGGTTLNFLVAQAPQCERCKGTGLRPSCLLFEDKTCIFRTLFFLWKGHWLVWNIKQLLPWKSKGLGKRVGSFKKALMVYIAPSPADMMEWRNKEMGTKSFSERKAGWRYSSGFCIALFHKCVQQPRS